MNEAAAIKPTRPANGSGAAGASGPGGMRNSSPFNRGAMLAVLVVGFAAFLAMLYFIGAGDTGGRETGAAHASSRGLNGYAGLADLIEAEGIEVDITRDPGEFDTYDLLILTPAPGTDAEELSDVLRDRQLLGPTMVILPKWSAAQISGDLSPEDEDRVRSDWVRLLGPVSLPWTAELQGPFAFTRNNDGAPEGERVRWGGYDISGTLPSPIVSHVEQASGFEPLVIDGSGRMLAFYATGEPGSDYHENGHWVLFVAEPDLVNNFGLSDPRRATAAMRLVEDAAYGDARRVVIDMSMHGYGGSANLLTLAFQPPFLAATLCLILAMLIVGWRAFMRFGPTSHAGQDIAFGKRRLVSNGAGLIVRARRLRLLADPYVTLMERRLGKMLGLPHPDERGIDNALAIRLPDEEPFSARAARLREAEKPVEILRAARALNELTGKLAR